MWFEIRKSSDGQYWYRVVGGNGEIMARSETMTRKQSCKDAIAVIKRDAAGASTKDETGEA